MRLPYELIGRIQVFTRWDLSTSIGCTRFAGEIREVVGESISANTIKRAFGIIKASSKPSAYTLNIIARYIGYADWDSFLGGMITTSSMFNRNPVLSLDKIVDGQSVRFRYSPNRCVTMACIGRNRFVITESLNSKLLVDDIVTAFQIVKHSRLEFADVIRNGKSLGAFTAGLHGGITGFEVIPTSV